MVVPKQLKDPISISHPSWLIDLFGRMRTSSPNATVVFRQDTPNRDYLLTDGQVSGTGTSSTYSASNASTILTVGTSVGKRQQQSTYPGLYVPGNSGLAFLTFNFEGTGQANVVKRVGVFDDNDGLYLEQNNGVLSVNISSSVTGGTPLRSVIQSDWNGDKFDANSPTYNFNHSACHILFIAWEWLGVGDVVFGFIYDRTPVVAHIFSHPNTTLVPYMRSANARIRYSIERTQAGVTSENFRSICGVIYSEGSEPKSGIQQFIQLGASRATANANTLYPIIVFRLQSAWLNVRALLETFEAVVTDNAATTAQFYLVRSPVFGGGYTPTYTAFPNSAIEYQSAGTVTPIPGTATITSYQQILLEANVPLTPNALVSGKTTSDIAYMGCDFANNAYVYALAYISNTQSNTIPLAFVVIREQT